MQGPALLLSIITETMACDMHSSSQNTVYSKHQMHSFTSRSGRGEPCGTKGTGVCLKQLPGVCMGNTGSESRSDHRPSWGISGI